MGDGDEEVWEIKGTTCRIGFGKSTLAYEIL